MSLLEPAVLEPFTLRIRKAHTSRPDTPWFNTYEFRNQTAVDLPDLQTACSNIVDYERSLHRQNTLFISYTLSTWVPDGAPYNPDTFVSVPISSLGTHPALDEAEPLTTCWRVVWRAQTGRMGFKLYRNCLSETDVTSPAGVPTLANTAGMLTRLNDARDEGPITGYFTEGGDLIQFMMESSASARPVIGLAVGGITIKKLNNRYFDRPG